MININKSIYIAFLKVIENFEKRYFALAMLVVIIYRIIYFQTNSGLLFMPDTYTYYYPFSLFEGNPHPFRMVLYPLLIKLSNYLKFDNGELLLIYFQRFVSLIAVFYFGRILSKIINKPVVVFLGIIYYGTNNTIVTYDNTLLAESISLSMVVIYLYMINKVIESGSLGNLVWANILVLLLIFTKPVFIVLLMVHFIISTFLYCYFKTRLMLLINLASATLSITLILAYSNMIYQKHGYYGLSTVSVNNNIANVINSGAYVISKDKEIVKQIDSMKSKNVYEVIFSLNNTFDVLKYKEHYPSFMINELDKVSYKQSSNYTFNRLDSFSRSVLFTKVHFKYLYHRLIKMCVTYKELFIICLIYILVLLYLIFIKVKMNLFIMTLILYILLSSLVVVVGGIDDWSRLLLPSLPCSIIMFSHFYKVVLAKVFSREALHRIKQIKNELIEELNAKYGYDE